MSLFFHCCPFFRCRKPPKSVFRLPEPPQNDSELHPNKDAFTAKAVWADFGENGASLTAEMVMHHSKVPGK